MPKSLDPRIPGSSLVPANMIALWKKGHLLMAPTRSAFAAASIAILWTLPLAANENWPQWRGPTGNGVSDSKNLPTAWSLETGENIVWKTELPAWSGSTPIIWGDYIFLTSPGKDDGSPPQDDRRGKGPPGGFGGKGDGKGPPQGKGGFGGGGGRGGSANKPAGPGGQSLLVICLSKKDGSVRWQK